jgi:hypothetical protein
MRGGSWWLPDEEGGLEIDRFIRKVTSPRTGGPRFVDPTAQAEATKLLEDPRTNAQIHADTFVDVFTRGMSADPMVMPPVSQRPAVGIIVTQRTSDTKSADHTGDSTETIGAGDTHQNNITAASGTSGPTPPSTTTGPTRPSDTSDSTGVNGSRPSFGGGYVIGTDTPVTMATIERFLCESEIFGIRFDSTGQCLDLERGQRLFSARQRIALAVRDGGCRVAGCDKPPSFCEAHHINFWARDKGKTNIADGILLCRHHHGLFHANGWEIVRDGGTYWLKPPKSFDPLQRLILMPSKHIVVRGLNESTVRKYANLANATNVTHPASISNAAKRANRVNPVNPVNPANPANPANPVNPVNPAILAFDPNPANLERAVLRSLPARLAAESPSSRFTVAAAAALPGRMSAADEDTLIGASPAVLAASATLLAATVRRSQAILQPESRSHAPRERSPGVSPLLLPPLFLPLLPPLLPLQLDSGLTKLSSRCHGGPAQLADDRPREQCADGSAEGVRRDIHNRSNTLGEKEQLRQLNGPRERCTPECGGPPGKPPECQHEEKPQRHEHEHVRAHLDRAVAESRHSGVLHLGDHMTDRARDGPVDGRGPPHHKADEHRIHNQERFREFQHLTPKVTVGVAIQSRTGREPTEHSVTKTILKQSLGR